MWGKGRLFDRLLLGRDAVEGDRNERRKHK